MNMAILAFLESPLGRLTMYVIGALFGVATLVSVYLVWRHQVEQETLLKYNNQQLQQALKDTQDQLQKTRDLFALQQQTADELKKQRAELNQKTKAITDFIDSSKEADKPASDLLKGTLEKLGAPK